MSQRYVAITQLELNLRFSENGEPVRHLLQALLLDPSDGWRAQRLDLRYPGKFDRADVGEFIVSAVGDPDGDGRSELVYGVTIGRGDCYILAYRHEGGAWRAEPIVKDLPAVDLIRSIALGDIDKDGADEIVLGTRPNGAVYILDSGPAGYAAKIIDRDQYGVGTTNTREVSVADVDGDGALEILVATARASAENWHATPGAIFLYRNAASRWDKTLIDDHRGQTHTRMVAVADVRNDGINRIVSSAVGVVQPDSGRIDPLPELRIYTLSTVSGVRPACEPIDTFENMIKSRSFAAGDVDGDGRVALVVGTRALGGAGLDTTCLFIYRFDPDTQVWNRETLDTSGPLGFHCVAIGDVDGDGRCEILASDDGRGQIKLYKKLNNRWEREVIYDTNGGVIFCSAIHLIDIGFART